MSQGPLNVEVQQGIDAYRAIWINGHPNGSIMVRLANLEESQEQQDREVARIEKETEQSVEEIKKGIEALPKKILLWMTIIGTILWIFNFLTPSLQKHMNMSENPPAHEISEHATIPYIGR